MDRQQFVGMYDLQDTLGKGHFSVVKQAQHVLSKQKVAIKVIEKAKLNALEQEHLHHEVRVMKMINHPNIVRLYQVIDTIPRLYLILELGSGGDLHEFIVKHGPLADSIARKYFIQIVSAVQYCHHLRIVHRDLKPENVVFCQNEHGQIVVKVTDFGLSNNFCPGEKMKTMCGSLCYTAPEVLLQEPYDGPAADRWSLGVILFMMVAGRLPFREHNDSITLFKIIDVKYTFPDEVPDNIRAVVGSLLLRNPAERMGLEEVLAMPWLAGSRTAATHDSKSLSDSDHAGILRTMSNAGLDVTKVEKSLAESAYDYYSGTYYLLADQLHKKDGSEAHVDSSESSPKSTGSPQSSPRGLRRNVSLSSRPVSIPGPVTPPTGRRASVQIMPSGVNIATGKHTGSLRRPRPPELTSPAPSPCSAALVFPRVPTVTFEEEHSTDRIDLSQSFPSATWSRSPSGGSISSASSSLAASHARQLFRDELHRSFSAPDDGMEDAAATSAAAVSFSRQSSAEQAFIRAPRTTERNSRVCVIS
eukprot:m.66877 g.66877  ORF g.66877 m.66877 type:complete len:530 (+) comp12672_c1_seq1:291-1880(+)